MTVVHRPRETFLLRHMDHFSIIPCSMICVISSRYLCVINIGFHKGFWTFPLSFFISSSKIIQPSRKKQETSSKALMFLRIGLHCAPALPKLYNASHLMQRSSGAILSRRERCRVFERKNGTWHPCLSILSESFCWYMHLRCCWNFAFETPETMT